jgi:hypothetical protein
MTYTPAAVYSGSDSFTVSVSDGTASATRTINVTVYAPTPFYVGNALRYADNDDSLYRSPPLTDAINNVTMEAWVKADTLSGTAPISALCITATAAPEGTAFI